MKKLTLLSIFSIVVLTVSFGQRIDFMLIPFEANDKWGYMNHDRKVVVEPIFEAAYPTYNMRGLVKMKGKYGFVDNAGRIVIKPKYHTAVPFSYGLSKVKRGRKTYHINSEGKKSEYGYSMCGAIYQHCLKPIEKPRYVFEEAGKYGFAFQRMTRVDTSLIYTPDTIKPIFDTIVSLDHQLTYIKKGGKIAFFHDGSSGRFLEDKENYLRFNYDDLQLFQCLDHTTEYDNIIGVMKDGLWGYVKFFYDVEPIVEPKYLSIAPFHYGLALVEYEPGRYGYISSTGKEFFAPEIQNL